MLPIKGVKIIKDFCYSHSAYQTELFMMEEKVAALSLQMQKMQQQISENERLKSILQFKEEAPYNIRGAQVIGRVPETWNNIVLINKGNKDGINRKDLVSTEKGVVGSVIEVFPYTSKVMLVTNPSSKIGVVLEKTRQNGVLAGTSSECKVLYLSVDSDIMYGEKVFTSGLGGIFPEGILVGTIKKVKKDPIGLYKYAIVELAQDLNALGTVLCIE